MAQIPSDIEKKLKAVIRRIEEAAVFDGVGNESFDASTSIKTLSKVSGMSERSLRDWFKIYAGQKISHYISKRRAEYATRIFRLFPDTSKSEVSNRIGLSNPQALYPFMRKNGIPSIDGLRGTYKLPKDQTLNFRYDRIPDCILFYTLIDIAYKECSTTEFEIENWGGIENFIKCKFPEATIIGYVGFAIDRYIDNKTEEGIFISGILCNDVERTRLPRDIIGMFGWWLLPCQEYAVFTHNGNYESLSDIYFHCLETLRQNAIQIDKFHLIMERYLNSPFDTPADELKTEIWVPIIRANNKD